MRDRKKYWIFPVKEASSKREAEQLEQAFIKYVLALQRDFPLLPLSTAENDAVRFVVGEKR
jgi:hypothetical protein